MEKHMHTCRQCGRSFANSRALGGHVRSHVLGNVRRDQPSSSAGSYSSRKDEVGSKQVGGYGLRGNPKKTIRLLEDPDHTYSSAAFADQDYGSEIEPINERGSKRVRNPQPDPVTPEPEHGASSVTEVTTDEEGAISLMILSRDKWCKYEEEEDSSYQEDHEADAEDYNPTRPESEGGRYPCGACRRVFKSYQALGGHKASHKKGTGCRSDPKPGNEVGGVVQIREEAAQMHECPFCPRVFTSGQALGGHKRIHMLDVEAAATTTTSNNVEAAESSERRTVEFDLNMPAQPEDAEQSGVSDS